MEAGKIVSNVEKKDERMMMMVEELSLYASGAPRQ